MYQIEVQNQKNVLVGEFFENKYYMQDVTNLQVEIIVQDLIT